MSISNEFTKFLAYLDTLHDFCGARNKIIPIQVMRGYVASAFGFKDESDAIRSIHSHVRTDELRKQAADLFYYRAGKFNTFEQNVVDFVMTVSRMERGDAENVVEINIKKNVESEHLKALIPTNVVYDTSVLSYDYICNKLNEKISVTMATNWDGDGTNINLPRTCEDDQTSHEFRLSKDYNELSTLNDIIIKGNTVSTVVGGKKYSMTWDQIQEELHGFLNVKSYVLNVKDPSKIKQLFRNFLQITPTQDRNISFINTVGRITDVKRSGDWLQLQAMTTLRTKLPTTHKDMMLYTVDTPLAARALSVNETAVVTYAPPGKGEINVRIIGNTDLSPDMFKAKTAELEGYKELVLGRSWLKTEEDIGKLISNLNELIYKIVATKWRSKKELAKELAIAEQIRVDDLGHLTYPITDFLRQKHIQILSFLIHMSTLLQHLQKHRKVLRYQEASSTKRQKVAEKKDPSQALLKEIREMKSYFTDILRLPSIDMINVLDPNSLADDITAVTSYIENIPDVFTKDLIHHITSYKSSSTTPITNHVHYMMNEMADLHRDLYISNDRTEQTRIPKYSIGRSEANYRKYASAVNTVICDTQYHMKEIANMDKKLDGIKVFKNKAVELKHFIKNTMKMKGGVGGASLFNQRLFDLSVASGNYFIIFALYNRYIDRNAFRNEIQYIPTLMSTNILAAPVVKVSRNGIAHVPEALLLNDSPFIQQYFSMYPVSPRGIKSIPIEEYVMAMFIRDMFLMRNQPSSPNSHRPSPPHHPSHQHQPHNQHPSQHQRPPSRRRPVPGNTQRPFVGQQGTTRQATRRQGATMVHAATHNQRQPTRAQAAAMRGGESCSSRDQ